MHRGAAGRADQRVGERERRLLGASWSSVAELLAATGVKVLPAASVATCSEAVIAPSAKPDRSRAAVPLALTVLVVMPPKESVKVTTALSSGSRPPTVNCTALACAVRIVVSTKDSDSAGLLPLVLIECGGVAGIGGEGVAGRVTCRQRCRDGAVAESRQVHRRGNGGAVDDVYRLAVVGRVGECDAAAIVGRKPADREMHRGAAGRADQRVGERQCCLLGRILVERHGGAGHRREGVAGGIGIDRQRRRDGPIGQRAQVSLVAALGTSDIDLDGLAVAIGKRHRAGILGIQAADGERHRRDGCPAEYPWW